MVGDLTRSTNNNIEQQSLEFVIYTLLPWLVRWEQEITLKLLPSGKPHGAASVGRNAAKTFFVEFGVNALIRGDFETRTQGYAVARQWGWMSADDVREQEGMNPLPNGQGKIYLVPMNMVDAALVADPPAGSGLPGADPAPQLPSDKDGNDNENESGEDTEDDSTTNDGANAQDARSRKQQQYVARFVAGYFRIFRSAFSASLTVDRASDKLAMYRLFAPVLTSLAEMFSQQACSELRVEPLNPESLAQLVNDYLSKMTARSSKWNEELGDEIARNELGRAVRTLSIAAYQEAATQKAKRISRS